MRTLRQKIKGNSSVHGHLLRELCPLVGSLVTHACSANAKLHCAPALASHKWSGRCDSEGNPRSSSILIRRDTNILTLHCVGEVSHKILESQHFTKIPGSSSTLISRENLDVPASRHCEGVSRRQAGCACRQAEVF